MPPFIVIQTIKAQSNYRHDELAKAAFIGEVFTRTEKLSQSDLNKFLSNPPKRDEHVETMRILSGLGISEQELIEAQKQAAKARKDS